MKTTTFAAGKGLAAAFCLGQLLSGPLLAQSLTNQPVATPANPPPAASALPPPVPAAESSPVDFFRKLLAMTVSERSKALADRSAEKRKAILAKVREYESLKADQRELRLAVTELRWYLLPLMTMPANERVERLAATPKETRKLVEERLQAWDALSPDVQKEFLKNESIIRQYIELAVREGRPSPSRIGKISPARRDMLTTGIEQIQQLPEQERQALLDRFDKFFGLNAQEKEKALRTLSRAERQQIAKTLRDFGNLTAEQRTQCIRSFERFANLSLAERQQFLKNAERWKLMAPDDRQAWRELVDQMPITPVVITLPPRPPRERNSGLPVATNGR